MLLYGLFVLDFDVLDLYEAWAIEHPELATAPAERTKKGVHVYFVRCEAVEATNLTSGPLVNPTTREKAHIDRMTITKEGTGSLLVCAPSPNYVWMEGRSLMDIDPKPMSPELLAKVILFSPTMSSSGNRGNKQALVGPTPSGPNSLRDPCLFASDADFLELMHIFGLDISVYVTQKGSSTVARQDTADTLKYGNAIEMFMARSTLFPCLLCGKGPHEDRLRFVVSCKKGSYSMTGTHQQNNKTRGTIRPSCQKQYHITTAAIESYIQRFKKKTPQLQEAEATAIRTSCTHADLYVESDAAVYRLSDPAPGFFAHALQSAGVWYVVMQPSQGKGLQWWRRTELPGLKYEYMNQANWTSCRNGDSAANMSSFNFPIWSPYV